MVVVVARLSIRLGLLLKRVMGLTRWVLHVTHRCRIGYEKRMTRDMKSKGDRWQTCRIPGKTHLGLSFWYIQPSPSSCAFKLGSKYGATGATAGYAPSNRSFPPSQPWFQTCTVSVGKTQQRPMICRVRETINVCYLL